jgi:F-type H+-transporting ATPase subunit b
MILLANSLTTPAVGTLFWSALIFLLFFLILTKFAWKPILAAVKARDEMIKGSLESAARAREEMLKLQSDNEAILRKAREERENILKEAREVRDKLERQQRRLTNLLRKQEQVLKAKNAKHFQKFMSRLHHSR